MSFNQTWRETPTKLFLNGPSLSFTSEPSSATINHTSSGSFVGVATATFPASVTDAESDGAIQYQWYRRLATESSFSALSAGSTFYSGQDSTTLSIDYALSPDQHNSEYYLEPRIFQSLVMIMKKLVVMQSMNRLHLELQLFQLILVFLSQLNHQTKRQLLIVMPLLLLHLS